MQFDLPSALLGLVLGVFLTLAIAYPRVGRNFARFASVMLFIGGIGMIVWAAAATLTGDTLIPFEVQGILVSKPSEAFGWGAGLLGGGILTLVLSCLGGADVASLSNRLR